MRRATTAARLLAVKMTGLPIENLLETNPREIYFGSLRIGKHPGIWTTAQVRDAVQRTGFPRQKANDGATA